MALRCYKQAFGLLYSWCHVCSSPQYFVFTCIMYSSLMPVWSLRVSAIHCLTLLLIWLLQVPQQQQVDRAARWSFECYHPATMAVSVDP